jgi:monoamine oxidase
MSPPFEVIIVGGGLAGLALADRLQRASVEWQLVEATEHLGGRVKSVEIDGAAFDLGPAWIWPGQPRLAELARRFGLKIFDQYSSGAGCFEDERGQVHRGAGVASMEGSWRVDGGLTVLTQALATALDPRRLRTGAAVTAVRKGDAEVAVELASGEVIRGGRVVLALPPRLAAALRYQPALPTAAVAAMQRIPTWMGGHAKLLAVYARPFWREAKLSGDAMSQRGPLAEIHDASAASGAPAALFGFVGVPVAVRLANPEAIKAAALQQLARIFGAEALAPRALELQDWAAVATASTELDHAPPRAHPAYGLPAELGSLWEGRLALGSTEVAAEFGGYLEGALAAAEQVATGLLTR